MAQYQPIVRENAERLFDTGFEDDDIAAWLGPKQDTIKRWRVAWNEQQETLADLVQKEQEKAYQQEIDSALHESMPSPMLNLLNKAHVKSEESTTRWRKRLPRPTLLDLLINWPAHVIFGAISGAGIMLGEEFLGMWEPFGILLALFVTYQIVEYWRRNDTPGRDIGHAILGVVIGFGFGLWVLGNWRDWPWLPDLMHLF